MIIAVFRYCSARMNQDVGTRLSACIQALTILVATANEYVLHCISAHADTAAFRKTQLPCLTLVSYDKKH